MIARRMEMEMGGTGCCIASLIDINISTSITPIELVAVASS